MTLRKKILLSILILSFHFSLAQKTPIALLNETSKYIDLTDAATDRAWKLTKKALQDRSLKDAKERCADVLKLAEEAEANAQLAEKKADESEQAFQQKNCDGAASKADDAEDFCRHLGYYTHEMIIYTRKAINEKDDSFFRAYLNKVINYAEDSYESVKNAKIGLEEAQKEAESCSN